MTAALLASTQNFSFFPDLYQVRLLALCSLASTRTGSWGSHL